MAPKRQRLFQTAKGGFDVLGAFGCDDGSRSRKAQGTWRFRQRIVNQDNWITHRIFSPSHSLRSAVRIVTKPLRQPRRREAPNTLIGKRKFPHSIGKRRSRRPAANSGAGKAAQGGL